ncbi:MAG: SpoIID/LytB domain-containing protein [bacterium]
MEKTKWVDTVAAIAIAALFVVISAFTLRYIEQRILTARAEAPGPIDLYLPADEIESPTEQYVSRQFTDGYISNNYQYSPELFFVEIKTEQIENKTEIDRFSWIRKLFGINTALAAEQPTYQASLVSQSYETVRLFPGRGFTISADFENTGTAAWTNNGENFIALNVDNPAGRTSEFQHEFWNEYYYRPARLLQSEVKTGEIGRVIFALKAPQEPGEYVENFGLVAENLSWIEGGKLSLKITIPEAYEARLHDHMEVPIKIEPSKAITFWAEFKNMGTATWTNNSKNFIALNTDKPVGRVSEFQHDYWSEHFYRPARLMQSEVKPGEIGRVKFALQAPSQPGYYLENFGLVAEGLTWLPGGKLVLPITVGSPELLEATEGGPLIRVGLTSTNDPVVVTGDGQFTVTDSLGKELVSVPPNKAANIEYNDKKYTISANGQTITSKSAIRLVPKQDTILQVKSFENRPGWNAELNDNLFRGVIEVRYAEKTDKVWVINELSLEEYLRGIAETSNDSPFEFQKALMIAARSYAWYHIQTNTKHADENFTVDATYDQVYRGYGFEQRAPNVSQAVEATQGIVVAYEDEPVITPYYSHSDGRTRSWEEVWAGDPKPWLVPVEDPCCTELELYGHGVGMSAKGAIHFALEGQLADQILNYYYTDTTLKQIYE